MSIPSDVLTVVAIATTQTPAWTRGGDGGQVRQVVEQTVSVEQLQTNFAHFMDCMQQVLAVSEGRVGDMVLDEITFRVEIGAGGEFKLLGTGVAAEANSSLTFTLRRESSRARAGIWGTRKP